MLQQTQVSRVLGFYARFIARFPTIRHLAGARPSRVMECWEGLGYYARARNLHKLARHVTRDGGDGRLPAEPHELRKLPGIGAYTAGAVASFAYEKRAALVDTNVARVLSRVFAPRLNPKRPRDLKQIWRDRRGCAAENGQGRLDPQPGPDGARRARVHGEGQTLRGVSAQSHVQERRMNGKRRSGVSPRSPLPPIHPHSSPAPCIGSEPSGLAPTS